MLQQVLLKLQQQRISKNVQDGLSRAYISWTIGDQTFPDQRL